MARPLPCSSNIHMHLIRHKHRHYTKVYIRETAVKLSEIGARPRTWLAEVIGLITERSKLIPLPTPEIYSLLSMLKEARSDSKWRQAANTPLDDLTLAAIIDGVQAFEHAIESAVSVAYRTKQTASGELCKWSKRLAAANGIPRVDRLNRYFRTLFPPRSTVGRGMISDLVDEAPPLGATPHENPSDLRRQTGKRIEQTLAKVRAACCKELDEAEAWSREFTGLVCSRAPSPEFVARLGALTVNRPVWNATRDHRWIAEADPIDLLAGYYELMVISQKNRAAHLVNSGATPLPCKVQPLNFGAVRGREIVEFLASRFGLERAGLMDLQVAIFNVQNGGFATSLACMLILQAHTGWNISAVLSLDDEKFEQAGGGLIIQSFKSKTGDFTPYVYIEASEEDVLRAIAYLRNRLAKLKALGWVAQDCTDVWLRPVSPDKPLKQWIAWNFSLKRFCEKHSLPKFSFEMMRNEALGKVANEKGGIEAARHMAGHTSITTTGRYVDQVLLHRRNSSISLMFQKALQASVKFEFQNAGTPGPASLNLLYPIGDGASCTDPHNPPHPEQLSFGLCEGKDCHAEGGCENRRIVINDARLEEIVRFSRHFRATWKQRLQENPDRFAAVDLPAWQFNQGLRGLIAKGPYRHRLKEVEGAVSQSEGSL